MSAPSNREPLDLEAIRRYWFIQGRIKNSDVPALCDEVERLRADLAAERRKVERVREHHFEDREGMCDGCRMTWPFPTIRAIAHEEAAS